MPFSHNEFLKRKARIHKSRATPAKVIDWIVYVLGPVSAVIFVPQLIKIYQYKNVAGVSLLSWSGVLAANIFWIIYGLIHKQRPITYVNIIGALVVGAIVIGIFLYR